MIAQHNFISDFGMRISDFRPPLWIVSRAESVRWNNPKSEIEKGGPEGPPYSKFLGCFLDQSLVDHGVRDLDETRDVGAGHIVALVAIFSGGGHAGRVNAIHDVAQLVVDLFAGP